MPDLSEGYYTHAIKAIRIIREMAGAAAGLLVCAAPVNIGSGDAETAVPRVCGNPPDATKVVASRADKVHTVECGIAEVCTCVWDGEVAMDNIDSDAIKAGAAVN